MDHQRSIRRFTLLIAVLALLITGLLSLLIVDNAKNKQVYHRQITDRVRAELTNVQEQLETLGESVLRSKSFSSFHQATDYPYFVYDNDSLVYWSDFHYVPDYHVLASNTRYKFIEDQDIQFIVQHQPIEGTGLSAYMLLPLHISRDHPNNYIQESFNKDVFSSEGDKVKINLDQDEMIVTSDQDEYLFSVSLADQIQIKSTPISYTILVLVSVAIISLLIYLFSLVRYLFNLERFNLGFGILILGLVLIRAGMLIFDFPGSILDFHIFDPQLYASSDINKSLGDLFFNELTLLVVVVFIFKNYLRLPWYKTLMSSAGRTKSFVAIIWLLASILLLYLQYYVITLFYHSQWSLDIASVLDFTFVKFLSLIIIVINAVVYFLVTHIAMIQCHKLLGRSLNQLMLHYAFAGLIFVTIAIVFSWSWPVVLTLSTLYLGVLYSLGITRYLGRFNYVSFLYLFLGALFCAVTGAYAINSYEKMENITRKQQLADQLLNERDFLGEFLLSEAVSKIKDDPYILNQVVFNPYSSIEAVIRKIERFYLSQHLDRYETSIHVFDASGDPVNTTTFLRYQDFQSKYASTQNGTEYQGLYFVNEITADQLSRYLYFIPLNLEQFRIGHIVLDLKLKRVIPNTVYPELLVHNTSLIKDNGISYAIYSEGNLINTSGTFNYAKDFDAQTLQSQLVYNRGVNLEGSHHLAVKGPSERVAVISSVTYPLRNVLGNFSFLFIIFIFCLILFILLYVFVYRRRAVKLNYATRIQLYLNMAFFLPLIIVSITTLSLISSYSKKEVIEKYFEKAEGVRNNIVTTLEQYQQGYMDEPEMAQSLGQLSLYSELDINLFSDQGKLIGTSQPKIYQYNLLSEFINPLAYHSIVENKNNSVLLNESVGLLEYKSAYVGIRSFDSGNLMGILSIPFFESQYELDKEIVVILINILNIFTFIFIVILIASYFASRALTVPLSLITQKIKKTTLTGYNEPLEWESDDEIGLMVGEYNRMLQNLEASKTALARSEKESAWREMAQQVAHEIKNPLTPMKLTLQHLKRTLTQPNTPKESISEKPLNSLLQQIDTLSDIATSFSSFAKMPVPKNERFEAGSVLKKTIQLHGNNRDHRITSDLEAGSHYVMGDSQLMGRIFSNLIINGIQAVPEERLPEIKISLYTDSNQLVIKFKDNGSGIPEPLQDKIFIPNFSTKDSGSGLGLSIAKRGVEHAGGKIWFKTSDQGTTIFIELPLVD